MFMKKIVMLWVENFQLTYFSSHGEQFKIIDVPEMNILPVGWLIVNRNVWKWLQCILSHSLALYAGL